MASHHFLVKVKIINYFTMCFMQYKSDSEYATICSAFAAVQMVHNHAALGQDLYHHHQLPLGVHIKRLQDQTSLHNNIKCLRVIFFDKTSVNYCQWVC